MVFQLYCKILNACYTFILQLCTMRYYMYVIHLNSNYDCQLKFLEDYFNKKHTEDINM
jgi:hypothetical protein